jgi:hypothetical protein
MRTSGKNSDPNGSAIDDLLLTLTDAETLEQLETRFLASCGGMVKADRMSWSNWAPDWSRLNTCQTNHRCVAPETGPYFRTAVTVCILEDRAISLEWFRKNEDFSPHDRKLCHRIGHQTGEICLRVRERQIMKVDWEKLRDFMEGLLHSPLVNSLRRRDVQLLAALMECRPRHLIASELGIRQDSLDKRLGQLRERLGLENHVQLLSTLGALKRVRISA